LSGANKDKIMAEVINLKDTVKVKKDGDNCEACDVLGDYMCAGTPVEKPGQTQNKKRGKTS